jgi:hypothetical protein
MRFKEFNKITLKEFASYDQDVEKMQHELKDAGADLGNFGPKGDGIDGLLGPYTRRAAKQFPDIANHYKEVLARPDSPNAGNVDISQIQDSDYGRKIQKVADKLGIEPNSLLKIIHHESGGNPKAQDPNHISAGLIGFTQTTAHSLGTSKEDLLQMSAVEQLDYVYKFYKMVGLKPGSDVGTMYMLTFMPAYAYAPDDTVLGQQGGGTLGNTHLSMDKIWRQNPVFGKSKGKSFFTVADVKNSVRR